MDDRPANINSSSKVTLIAGDVENLSIALDLVDQDIFKEVQQSYFAADNVGNKPPPLSDLADIFGLATGSAFVFGAAQILDTRVRKQHDGSFSRRDFLKVAIKGTKGLAVGTGTLAIGAIPARDLAITLSQRINSVELYQKFLTIASQLGPKLFNDRNWWTDGRTALLIAKTKDANFEKSAVVLGAAHIFESTRMLQDENLRQQKIATFLENMHLLINSIKNQMPELKNLDLVGRFDEYIAKYDLIEINDPRNKKMTGDDLVKEGYIKKTGTRVCKEVADIAFSL